MSVFLFQGDSITDCGRDRNHPQGLGFGYPFIASALHSAACPGATYVNRGISGNRAKDLLARWDEDCIRLQPTLVSILIGINDTWRRYDANDPTSSEDFEAAYRSLLEKLRAQTRAKIVLLEPFLLPVKPEQLRWREDLDPKIDAVRRLAREFADAYVPLDGRFAAASLDAPPAYWAEDGVHPTLAGHAVIAQEWLTAVRKVLPE